MSWQNNGPDLVGPEGGDTVTLASDADRDATVRVLNEAFAEGRLTADEHGERVRAVYTGRTWQELARLTADLPGPAHAARAAVGGMPYGLDWCLLCALLILCPPAAIAWLLTARHRSAMGQQHAVTAGGARSLFAAPDAAWAGDGWRAEDR